MPKRFIDGEALWGSTKLERVIPQWARPEYANLLPLALANGVFESASRRIWSMVYSFNRPDVTEKMVAEILDAFDRAGMLFRWTAEGRPWGYWVGIEKDGRLPEPSHRNRYLCGPEPPQEALKAYIRSHSGLTPARNALDRSALQCADAHLSTDVDVSESLTEHRCEQADEQKDEQGPDQANAEPAPSQAAKSEARGSTPRDAAVLLEIWQECRGPLAEVRAFSPERKRKAQARIRSHRENPEKFLRDFCEAVTRAASTPFLCGEGSTGWRADFDFFIANDSNYLKVLEGKYDSIRKGRASRNLEAAADFLRGKGGEVDGVPGKRIITIDRR